MGKTFFNLLGQLWVPFLHQYAPYAILVVAYLEEKLYNIIELKYGRDMRINFENNWDRFLDDCFTLLEGVITPEYLLTILK